MHRKVMLLTVLFATDLMAADADRTITTRTGKTFHHCKVVRVHPDGVSFTHSEGAAKIAFKDLPESLRREFRYDPKKAAEHQRMQTELRKEGAKRAKLREIVMEEKLMQAQMAEASYLAAANAVYRPASSATGMSLALPGEALPKVATQTPSWVGTPITGSPMGGHDYRQGALYLRSYPFWNGAGYGYPFGASRSSYGYGFGYAPMGAYVGPSLYRSWNVGSAFRVGVGISPFGNRLRVLP